MLANTNNVRARGFWDRIKGGVLCRTRTTQQGGSGGIFPIRFKLKKSEKNGNMGDPAPGEAGNQAVPHPVVDEANDDDVHPDSLHNNKPTCLHSVQSKRSLWRVIKFHHWKNSVLNPTSGSAGLDVSNECERPLASTRRTARAK